MVVGGVWEREREESMEERTFEQGPWFWRHGGARSTIAVWRRELFHACVFAGTYYLIFKNSSAKGHSGRNPRTTLCDCKNEDVNIMPSMTVPVLATTTSGIKEMKNLIWYVSVQTTTSVCLRVIICLATHHIGRRRCACFPEMNAKIKQIQRNCVY